MNRFMRGGPRTASTTGIAPPSPGSAAVIRTIDTFLRVRTRADETANGSWNDRRTKFVASCRILAEDILRLNNEGIALSKDQIRLRMIVKGLDSSNDFATSAVGIGDVFNFISHGVGMPRVMFGNSFELGEYIRLFCIEHGLEMPYNPNPLNLSDTTTVVIRLRHEILIRHIQIPDEEMSRLLTAVHFDIFSEVHALFREALRVVKSGVGELQPLVRSLIDMSGKSIDACMTLTVIAAFCANSKDRLQATERLLSLRASPDSRISITAHTILFDLQAYSEYGDIRRLLNDAGFTSRYYEDLFTREHPRSRLDPAVGEIHDQKRGFAIRVIGGERKIIDKNQES